MLMVPSNAVVCQVMLVTEEEAATVSFKNTSVLNMTHYVSILRDWGDQKRKEASLSLFIVCFFFKLLLFSNY